jgi:hypothetical protein
MVPLYQTMRHLRWFAPGEKISAKKLLLRRDFELFPVAVPATFGKLLEMGI